MQQTGHQILHKAMKEARLRFLTTGNPGIIYPVISARNRLFCREKQMETIMQLHIGFSATRNYFFRWARFASLLAPMILAGCSGKAASTPPDVISLPAGFRPEGVAIAEGKLYAGSIPTGRVYKADLSTGQGAVLVTERGGRSAVGLKVDGRGRIFVAGGATGKAFVYDAASGEDIAEFTLAQGTTFINDVIVTPQAAWFTDSTTTTLYRLGIAADGALATTATAFPLTGDIQFQTGTNVNGLAATPDGNTLLVIQSNTGRLFSVNTATGVATGVELGGESLPNGDGILLQGQTLYVVQNRLNQLAVLLMSPDLRSATVERRVTDPAFDVPSTVAASDGSLYLVNARFGVANPDTADYTVVRIGKP
jgi:sugar lactone lactonase YvrE